MKRFKAISWYMKKNWYKYLIVIVLVIIAVILDILKPELIGNALDLIESGNIALNAFIILIVTITIVFVGKFVINICKSIVQGHIFHKLFYELKIKFINQLLIQDANFYTKYHPGDLMTRATSDTYSVSNVSSHLIFSLIEMILLVIFSAIMMVNINPLLTLYAIIPLPFIFLVVVTLRPKISSNWRLVRKRNSDLSNKAMESVQHVKLIRAFVNEEDDCQRLQDVAYDCYAIERKSVLIQAIFGPTFRLFTIISQLVAFIYGAKCVMNQEISVPDLIKFNLYLGQFSWPMLQLGNRVALFAQSRVSFERIEEVMNYKPDIIDEADAYAIDDFQEITFNDIHFRYSEKGDEVLKGLSFTIKNGETFGIVGKTGGGKTTIVKQLLRQYPIDKEAIEIDGIPLNRIKKKSIRQLVAYVPQEHILFSRTVEENIMLGKSVDNDITLDQAIEMADFTKDLPFLADGLKTIVGEYGVTLSGGQKQRLSIARAFLKDAKILILDDSLSAVDGTTEANIIANLKRIRRGKTNIIVTHRLSAVENAHEIIVVENGKIIERGNHQQLMAQGGWYKEQYNLQLMEDID